MLFVLHDIIHPPIAKQLLSLTQALSAFPQFNLMQFVNGFPPYGGGGIHLLLTAQLPN